MSMSFYEKRPMTSKQGKAINHLYPSLFAERLKRPKVNIESQENTMSFTEMLKELEAQRLKAEEDAKLNKTEKPSCSFTAVSRDQHFFITRNKTESPKVGLYNPNWTAVRPNTTHGPKYVCKKAQVNEKRIFTPSCIKNDLKCTILRRKTVESQKNADNIGEYDKKIKRTVSNFKDYNEKYQEISKSRKNDPKKPKKKIQSPIKFNKQLKRKEFVSVFDPPNEHRFDFAGTDSLILSNNKKILGFSFEKKESRQELFPSRLSLPPYDRNEEFTMSRLNISIPDFSKTPERKELILTHMLTTPYSLELSEYEEAYFKQSTVRGPTKIPLMSTVAARDDLMYRTKPRRTI